MLARFPLEIPSDVSRIPLEDIKQATNNFAQQNIIQKKKILSDEFDWMVYKGELSGKKFAFISIRVIDPIELLVLNELTKHQNIVSLIGICDEDYPNKMILVVEHTRGGLDKYVTSAHLTWLMRVQICFGIASALHYLHNHPQRWVMYTGDYNLSSASIQLDENWQPKIQFITPIALLYAPPKTLRQTQLRYAYHMRHIGKQSEIYSFGVILFELLCARAEVTYDEEGGTPFLSKLACSHYVKGTLTEIIDPFLRVQMNRDSITIFSEVAYRCLSEDSSKRPTISVVIEQLQKVLKLQHGFEISELQQVRHRSTRIARVEIMEVHEFVQPLADLLTIVDRNHSPFTNMRVEE